ncbi:hypothetical protein ACJJI3_03570 [Microbulbifer sp. ZKSA004]|uniref:hypothetical protein n=1 Tax=Microbulbifer sp. ZKSA004 TaxID=3243389 RepID=UPI00403A3B7B
MISKLKLIFDGDVLHCEGCGVQILTVSYASSVIGIISTALALFLFAPVFAYFGFMAAIVSIPLIAMASAIFMVYITPLTTGHDGGNNL